MSYLKNFNLSQKTVFIVGSNGLIGREIVEACLDAEAKIICFDVKKNKTHYKNFWKRVFLTISSFVIFRDNVFFFCCFLYAF